MSNFALVKVAVPSSDYNNVSTIKGQYAALGLADEKMFRLQGLFIKRYDVNDVYSQTLLVTVNGNRVQACKAVDLERIGELPAMLVFDSMFDKEAIGLGSTEWDELVTRKIKESETFDDGEHSRIWLVAVAFDY